MKNRNNNTSGNEVEKDTCRYLAKEFSKKIGLTRDWCKELRSKENYEILGKLPCLAPHNDGKPCPRVFALFKPFIKHLQLDHKVLSTRVEYVGYEMKKFITEKSNKKIENKTLQEQFKETYN